MEVSSANWFELWFDTPYYHLLYSNRDDKEAEVFIDNIVSKFTIDSTKKVLDLACGKGRHAIYLSKKKCEVTGIDLSVESIKMAKLHESNTLSFHVHDMRIPFKNNYFDYVLNLFTSFGYFENEFDNEKVIQAIYSDLKIGGKVIIDFFNVGKVACSKNHSEVKIINGIEFTITKKIENNFVIKNIEIVDEGNFFSFQEKVQLLGLSDFERYLNTSNLKIENVFGNYQLEQFDSNTSDRLIIVASKV